MAYDRGWLQLLDQEGNGVAAVLTGKANLGFVSKYKRGATTPDGTG
jgi:hypothetical protein